MAELVPFGLEVAGVLAVRLRHDRDALVDAEPVALETDQLLWVVGDRTDRLHAEVEQDLRADAVVPQIGLKAELLIRLDRVGAAILQLVRPELVEQTNAPSFLVEVDDDAAAFGGDHAH